MDTESPIKEFHIMMGTSKGDDSVFSGGIVPGNIQTFTLKGKLICDFILAACKRKI